MKDRKNTWIDNTTRLRHRETSWERIKLSDRTPPASILSPMQDNSGFIEAGFRALGEEMADLSFRAGLERTKIRLSRRLYTHVRARLKLIETLLRRLLVLMAASIEVSVPHPEPVEGPAKAGTSSSQTAPSQPAPSQAGPSQAAPTPAEKRKARRGFALMPSLRERRPLDPSVFDTSWAELSGRGRRPLDLAPLMHRWNTVGALLRHPEKAARRMAWRLARLRAAGAPRPHCLVPTDTRRAPTEVQLIAAALPQRVARALSGWYDSG